MSSEVEVNKINKVHSKTSWLQDSHQGHYLHSKKMVTQTNFDTKGRIAEIIYFNDEEKTDSIDIYKYDENELISIITFDPKGKVIKTNKITYLKDHRIAESYFFNRENKMQHLTKYVYEGDTIKQYEIAEGKKLTGSQIKVVRYCDDCKEGEIQISVYDKNNVMINKFKTTYSEKKVTTVSTFPEIKTITTVIDGHGNPIETITRSSNNEVLTTKIYNYSSNGLIMGLAEYKGEAIRERGGSNFDILDDMRETNKSKLTKIIKYTYKYY
jgi:hypothetical protein